MRIFGFLSVLILLIVPLISAAHGALSYEFAPDISAPLNIGAVATPSQAFQTQNDFLSGVDLWADNPGAPGSATVELLSSTGVTLAARTITVPTIAPVWSGTRRHIDFPSQIGVINSQTYRLRITTGMPNLSLYQAPRSQLLQHNTTYYPEYLSSLVGPASLGATEQEFAFKFALYEVNETAPPILTNATATVLDPVSIRFSFNANEPVDFRVTAIPEGGGAAASTNFTGVYQPCGVEIGACVLTLAVSPASTYSYTLAARDAWNNESNVSGSFTTPAGAAPPSSGGVTPPTFIVNPPGSSPPPPPPPDTTPPAILNAHLVALTSTSVRIAWTTNEAANAELSLSQSTASNPVASITDPTYELEHVLEAPSGLAEQTAYAARLRSQDPYGNANTLTLNFTTPAANPAPSPEPPPPGTPPPLGTGTNAASTNTPGTSSGSGNAGGAATVTATAGEERDPETGALIHTATVAWAPPSGGEPDRGYRIDVFDANWRLAAQVTVKAGTHEVNLKNLAPGRYQVIVYENRGGIFRKITEPALLIIAGPSFFKKTLFLWSLFAFVFLVIGGGIYLAAHRRRRAPRKKRMPQSARDDIEYR